MRRAVGKIQMAQIARIEHEIAETHARQAELHARLAKVYDELAEGESIDLRTLRRPARPHRPEFPEISPLDAARADAVLREKRIKRRVGR